MPRLIVGLLALATLVYAVWTLESATAPLTITRGQTGSMPYTHFATDAARRSHAPVVVIAHGFAGSQQFMHPFAVTLARAGYNAITFDFPGHGRNASVLGGGLTDFAESTRVLVEAMGEMVRAARAMPEGDGRVALVGHSMASDIVIRAGMADAAVKAVVAVSAFSPDVTASSPSNLLVIDGALEPEMLHTEGRRIVGLASTDGKATAGTLYGKFEDGTARRLVLAEGVEHIAVLYSKQALDETRSWLDQAFGGPLSSDRFVDGRGPWIGVIVLSVLALAWALAGLLPRLATPPLGAGLRWRPLLAVAGIAAVATPLLLWKIRTDLLPIALADYVFMHFAVYGAIAYEGLRIVTRRQRRAGELEDLASTRRAPFMVTLACGLAVVAYATLALGLPIDRYVTNLTPIRERAVLVLVLFGATLPWFLVNEWITRGPGAPRFAPVATNALFLASLALAIALDLQRLFFLVIIVPVILALFVIYGLLSEWVYRRTGHPALAAVANALALAWFIALAFPLVGR